MLTEVSGEECMCDRSNGTRYFVMAEGMSKKMNGADARACQKIEEMFDDSASERLQKCSGKSCTKMLNMTDARAKVSPKALTPDQKENHERICADILEQTEKNPQLLEDVIRGQNGSQCTRKHLRH